MGWAAVSVGTRFHRNRGLGDRLEGRFAGPVAARGGGQCPLTAVSVLQLCSSGLCVTAMSSSYHLEASDKP